MLDRDTWLEVVDVLRAHRLRTLLTAFGVFWGILMLMVMLGFGNGLRVGVTRGMSGLAQNSVFMWTRHTTKPYGGFVAGRRIQLVNEDVAPVAAATGVAQVCPRAQLGGWRGGVEVTRKSKSAAFQIMGDVPEIIKLRPVLVPQGRFINQLDLEQHRKVAVIGANVVQELFTPGEDPIGETISINQVPFEVVGVIQTLQSGDAADRDASTLHIPLSTFQRAFSWGNRLGYLALLLEEGVSSEQALNNVRDALAQRHRFDPTDKNAIGYWDAAKGFARVQGLFMGIEGLVWFVGVMTLLSGMVGVSNIMLISVKERTREIGVRRALGAPPRAIVGMVMQEALVLTGLAGMLGIAAGVGSLELIGRFVSEDTAMFSAPFVGFWTVLAATAVLMVSGVVAGLLPARVALSGSTAEAVRP